MVLKDLTVGSVQAVCILKPTFVSGVIQDLIAVSNDKSVSQQVRSGSMSGHTDTVWSIFWCDRGECLHAWDSQIAVANTDWQIVAHMPHELLLWNVDLVDLLKQSRELGRWCQCGRVPHHFIAFDFFVSSHQPKLLPWRAGWLGWPSIQLSAISHSSSTNMYKIRKLSRVKFWKSAQSIAC